MRDWIFWLGLGVLLPQALWTRRTTPRFKSPRGDTQALAEPDSASLNTVSTDDTPLVLVGLGDSIIAGVGADLQTQALVAQSADVLAKAIGRSVAWQAHGKIGADARGIAARAAQLAWPEKVDVVLISTGVNDLLGLATVRDWQHRIEALVAVVQQHAPDAWIVFAGLPPLQIFPALPWPLNQLFGLRADHFDEILHKTVAPFERVFTVPIRPEVAPEGMAADGFHPGILGYQALSRLVGEALSPKFTTPNYHDT